MAVRGDVRDKRKTYDVQKMGNKIELSPSTLAITLNISGLNSSIQRHRLAEEIFLKTGSNLSTRDPL